MPARRKIKHYALALLFLLLVNYPLLSIANRTKMIFGFPVLFLYVFALWATVILVLFIGELRSRKKSSNE